MRNRFIWTVPAAAALLASNMVGGIAHADEEVTVPVSPAVLIDEITGVGATTDTREVWDIGATDLGVMWDDGNGGVLTAFRDTFSSPLADGAGTGNWRSNVLVRSTDTDLSDGMSFDWALTDESGMASEIVGSLKAPGEEHTTIPTAGIEVDGRQYMAYMSVRDWGVPGQWRTNYSQLVYSDDGGETWSDEGAPRWDNTAEYDDPFQMLSYARHDGFVYVMGTPNGRIGAASMARVAEDSLLDKDAYRYWDGSDWNASYDAAAVVLPAAVAETTLRYDEGLGLWQTIYLNGNADLVLRVGEAPQGPWGEEQILATQAEYPGLYGGYIHPWSDTGELYFALSIWAEYNVALMHVDLNDAGQVVRGNLLTDPSFERGETLGSVPGGWRAVGNGGIDNNTEWAKLGRRQFWVRSNTGTHVVAQEVQVTPWTSYRLTGWLKTGDSVGGSAGEGVIGARGIGPGATVIEQETFGDLDGWTQFTVEFNSGAAAVVEVFAGSSMTGDRWVQGDDFSLVATSEPGTNPNPTMSPTSTATPEPAPTTGPTPDLDIYTTPGFHNTSGREWMTVCEAYSQTTRCFTFIWATQVHRVDDTYVRVNHWVFNNLTYAASPRAMWAGNPLASTGEWTADDGRRWRTECDTAATGRNGCRSYAEASVIEATPSGYRTVDKFILNNIVRFS